MARGAGYYTSYTEATNISTAMQGPNYAGDQGHTNLGLGLVTFNADVLDFHWLNKILCWLQLGQAGGVYVADARCNGREKERWTVATRAALGSHAQLYMSAIGEDRARVGGSIIILNNY